MSNKQPRPWVSHKSIKFIWPLIYTDNSFPDTYIPFCAPQTVAEIKPKLLTRSASFPWNTDQNTKTPLANNTFLVVDADNTLEVISNPITNTNNADESVVDEYSEGIPEA